MISDFNDNKILDCGHLSYESGYQHFGQIMDKFISPVRHTGLL